LPAPGAPVMMNLLMRFPCLVGEMAIYQQ